MSELDRSGKRDVIAAKAANHQRLVGQVYTFSLLGLVGTSFLNDFALKRPRIGCTAFMKVHKEKL